MSEVSPSGHRFADRCLFVIAAALAGSYVLLLSAMFAADVVFTAMHFEAIRPDYRELSASFLLTVTTCSITTFLSLITGLPLAYFLARGSFRGQAVIDAILDLPLILPPMVLGLSLLILFTLPIGGTSLERFLNERLGWQVTYATPAIVLAQYSAACAVTVRSLKATLRQIDPRPELVALTLGCTRWQAIREVLWPQARGGIVAAGALAWARSLGEFGPILVFAGATRMKTEVLSTSIYLEWSVGRLETAVAVSLAMLIPSAIVLAIVRAYGDRTV